jgi:hypothetical protein
MLILIYFLPKGLGGNQYNSWNVANGSELIDPVTRVREGVTKNTPERWEDYAFQASVRSETNLTMGGGEGKQIISLHLVI